jgi:transketolase
VAVEHDGPTALVLSRQNLPVVCDGSAVDAGAGVLRVGDDVVIVATGSEVSVALDAAERLASESISARVVSMPSWDRFEKFRATNSAAADAILPRSLPTLSVEAGATMGWHKYADECIGIDRFGASAPGATALVNLGIEAGNVVSTVRRLLGRGN